MLFTSVATFQDTAHRGPHWSQLRRVQTLQTWALLGPVSLCYVSENIGRNASKSRYARKLPKSLSRIGCAALWFCQHCTLHQSVALGQGSEKFRRYATQSLCTRRQQSWCFLSLPRWINALQICLYAYRIILSIYANSDSYSPFSLMN
jgi:hypothetical protein